MELIVLGAGPAYTDRTGALGSAYLLLHEGRALLLDFGQGTFPSLARAWEPSRLSAVLISHLHPDHFIDLVPLRHYLRYEFSPPRRVTVHAPEGLARRLDALLDEPGFTATTLDVVTVDPGPSAVGPFIVEASRVAHSGESYAFRVSTSLDGRGLVYSGDCGRAEDLRSLIRPGDDLLAEVSFGAEPIPDGAQHLNGPSVGELAASTGVRRVLLTHLQMGFDPDEAVESARRLFSGEISLVAPADRLTI